MSDPGVPKPTHPRLSYPSTPSNHVPGLRYSEKKRFGGEIKVMEGVSFNFLKGDGFACWIFEESSQKEVEKRP